jgi:maltokinase
VSAVEIDRSVFAAYLVRTRWFGGKGREFEVTGVRRLGLLGTGDPTVDVLLVELTYADATGDEAIELYQTPLSYYTDPQHRIDHAFVGWWEDPDLGWVHAYDALHDREATRLWLQAFGAAADGPVEVGGLTFHRLPGHELELAAPGSLFTGEQSNSSVAFGDDSVLKLFRKVTPGPNPDITTHEALTRADSPDVAHLYGWVEHEDTHLGMLQQFLRTATDGWDLALTSVRNLYADPELAARDAGGDFSGESGRLGDTLREVHAVLREHFGEATLTADVTAAQMNARLDAALPIVPQLAEHEASLRALFDRLAEIGELPVQRIHGDLHLGQTLRTALGWKIVDFEGEPAKTLAERLLPDSPWRDVAGMLRSFDYAAHAVERNHDELDPTAMAELRVRGAEWVQRNQRYFLGAYAGGELTPEQRTLVTAYTADKAVYETVYETRNRPAWVDIPLAAVARIGAPS